MGEEKNPSVDNDTFYPSLIIDEERLWRNIQVQKSSGHAIKWAIEGNRIWKFMTSSRNVIVEQ